MMGRPQLLGLFFTLTLGIVPALHPAVAQTPPHTLHTIVIDPGHGGEDDGCHGVFSKGKNVALAVSLQVGKLIQQAFPDIKVIYTRTTDQFVGLEDRAKMANDNKADLFLCIHCNANPNTTAYGTETYLMGLHKAEGNLEVEQRENSVITMEKDYASKYDGFDPNSPEAYIMFSLNQNAHIDECIYLSSAIENEFTADGRFSRGVKQAGFWVLWRTSMPSILCEIGFLTNPLEEQYLNSAAGQNEIAHSFFHGLCKYKNAMESESFSLTAISVPRKNADSSVYRQMMKHLTSSDQTAVKDTVKKAVSSTSNPPVYEYKVQIYGSAKPINMLLKPFSEIPDMEDDPAANGFHRYVVGHYTSLSEALQRQSSLKSKGFSDCFIVTYKSGKRVN